MSVEHFPCQNASLSSTRGLALPTSSLYTTAKSYGRPSNGISSPLLYLSRLNIGGKFLTNHLKEVISYRHYNMMDETYLINKVKETCCFVSQNFSVDLENVKHKRQGEIKYVLPDYSNSKEGYVLKEGATVKEDQQVLVLGNERFSIPEILFTPGDVGTINHTVLKSGTGLTVGSKQGGIAEAVIQAVNASPEELRSMLLANIVLTGGNSKLPGFLDRLCSARKRS